MKVKVDIDYDQADKIAVENLRALAANLQYDLRSRKEGTEWLSLIPTKTKTLSC